LTLWLVNKVAVKSQNKQAKGERKKARPEGAEVYFKLANISSQEARPPQFYIGPSN